MGNSVLKRTQFTGENHKGLLAYVKTLQRSAAMVEGDATLYVGYQRDYVLTGRITLQLIRDLQEACMEVAEDKTKNDIPKPSIFKDQQNNQQRPMPHISGRASLVYDTAKT